MNYHQNFVKLRTTINSKSNLQNILNDFYVIILSGTFNINSLGLLFIVCYDYFY